MLKLLQTTAKGTLLVTAVLAMSACSSTPETPVMAQFQPQYCHTKSQYTLQDGTKANSRIDVSCTDNPEDKHFLSYSDIAKNCREHWYDIRINNRLEKQRGYICQKFDGSWEIVNHPLTQITPTI